MGARQELRKKSLTYCRCKWQSNGEYTRLCLSDSEEIYSTHLKCQTIHKDESNKMQQYIKFLLFYNLHCCTVHVVSISSLLFQLMHFTTL